MVKLSTEIKEKVAELLEGSLCFVGTARLAKDCDDQFLKEACDVQVTIINLLAQHLGVEIPTEETAVAAACEVGDLKRLFEKMDLREDAHATSSH